MHKPSDQRSGPGPGKMRTVRIGLTCLTALLLAALAVPCLGQQGNRGWEQRDRWQRPDEVMAALEVREGSRVADVGAGRGYFTFHLAQRVGPQGKVYAVDIDASDLRRIRNRAERNGLTQIVTIHSKTDDPSLPPASLDAILVVNAYHEFRQYDAMMEGMANALKPGGLLAIIDSPTKRADSRSPYYRRHSIPAEIVKEDATRAGLRLRSYEADFAGSSQGGKDYLVLFQKPVE